MWACPSRTRTVNHACTHARYRCRRLCRLELPRRTQRALGMQRTGGSVGERPRAHGRGGPRRASAASRDARGAAHMLLSSTSSRGRAACLATSYTESTVLLDPAVAHSVRRCHAPWGPQCAAKIPSHAPARGSGHAVLRFPRACAGAGGGGGGDGARQGTSWRRRRACAGAGQRTEVHADCEGHLVRHIEQSGFHELFFRPGPCTRCRHAPTAETFIMRPCPRPGPGL